MLMQVRQFGQVHAHDFDYSIADRMLDRMRLALELAIHENVGPTSHQPNVVISELEYFAMSDVALIAKLTAIPPSGFDRRLYARTMRQMAQAVGRPAIEWQVLDQRFFT